MSEAVYSNLLSTVEIWYITAMAENHANFAAYCHSKMIVLMVRELSQTSSLCIFHMLKFVYIIKLSYHSCFLPSQSNLPQAKCS